MNLFENNSSAINLLPLDGEVYYYGKVLAQLDSKKYFETLLHEINWENDKAIIFGKEIITKRKVAWYGDKPYEYSYSNTTKKALLWTAALLELKSLCENLSAESYNSCLLNLYHNGNEGMAWHSDGEKDLKPNGAIASLSFGAERQFSFKHKSSQIKKSILLEHGSLLLMKGTTQKHWLHRLAPTKKIHGARINLTFRTIVEN